MTSSGNRYSNPGLLLPCRHSLLHHCVPLTTRRTSAHPFRTLVSAFLAEPHRLCLYCRHICFIWKANIQKDIVRKPGQYLLFKSQSEIGLLTASRCAVALLLAALASLCAIAALLRLLVLCAALALSLLATLCLIAAALLLSLAALSLLAASFLIFVVAA